MADAKSLLQIVDRSVIQLGEEIKNPKGVRFFTEHDVQAYLYNLLSGELEKQHLLMASAAPTKRIYQYSTWQLSADAASILHCEFPQKKRSVRYDIALLSPPTELKPGQDAYRSRPVAVGIEIKCSLLWHPPSIEKEIREAANKKHNDETKVVVLSCSAQAIDRETIEVDLRSKLKDLTRQIYIVTAADIWRNFAEHG